MTTEARGIFPADPVELAAFLKSPRTPPRPETAEERAQRLKDDPCAQAVEEKIQRLEFDRLRNASYPLVLQDGYAKVRSLGRG
jgi:hypothetical protein